MKKKMIKKLVLSRETLRGLEGPVLPWIQGGLETRPSNPTNCTCDGQVGTNCTGLC